MSSRGDDARGTSRGAKAHRLSREEPFGPPTSTPSSGVHAPAAPHGHRNGWAAHVGAWQYDEQIAGCVGFEPSAVSLWPTWDSVAHPSRARIGLVGRVRFPADTPDADSPAGLTVRAPECATVVVVPHDDSNLEAWTSLLEALARQGFVAAHVRIPCDIPPFEQADVLFEHLVLIRQAFGDRVPRPVGLLGLGPRAEAVFDMARLNRELGIGLDIDAAMAFGTAPGALDISKVVGAAVPVFRRHLLREVQAPGATVPGRRGGGD